MEEYIRDCVVCNKQFTTNKSQKICCSGECRQTRDRIMRKNYQKNKRIEKRAKMRRKTGISELAMVERLAREHGLTYGNYVGLYEYR